jgi:hypothetical protein
MGACKVKDFAELPVCLTGRDIADTMGISLANAYLVMKRAGFPSIRVSAKRIVVPRDKFLEWLDRETDREI